MFLKNEIEKLRISLFSTISEKEKLFYHFVTKQPFTETIEMPTGDLDKICFSVFTNSSLDVSDEVQRIALSEPYKHIHYSNSIITLVPVCLKSDEAKNKYLNNYFDSHSLAEKFLLTKNFPFENLQVVAQSKTALDKLINDTFFHPNFENAIQNLPVAFTEVSDIIGLLAFRFAYLELLNIHPNKKIESQFVELSNEVNKLLSVVTNRISFTVDFLTFVILIVASPLAVYELNKYYDKLEIDRLSNIWTFVSPILAGLLLISKRIFPKLFFFYDDFKHSLVVFWFWLRKINYKKLSQLTNANKLLNEVR